MIIICGFMTALECTKFVFGWGCALDPAGGAYSAPKTPRWFKRALLLRGKGGKGRGRKKRKGEGSGGTRDHPDGGTTFPDGVRG